MFSDYVYKFTRFREFVLQPQAFCLGLYSFTNTIYIEAAIFIEHSSTYCKYIDVIVKLSYLPLKFRRLIGWKEVHIIQCLPLSACDHVTGNVEVNIIMIMLTYTWPKTTDKGSCHFHCTVLAALCGAGVCFCLFLALNVVYLPIYAKLGLVIGMTKQMSNDKEADIVNC